VRRILISFALALLITGVPLALAVPFHSKDWFRLVVQVCDWPMLLVQHLYPQIVHGTELDRLITFFLVNIVTWSVLAMLGMRAIERRSLASDR
jgi:hypothetical protein